MAAELASVIRLPAQGARLRRAIRALHDRTAINTRDVTVALVANNDVGLFPQSSGSSSNEQALKKVIRDNGAQVFTVDQITTSIPSEAVNVASALLHAATDDNADTARA
jgi:hypothetical protein